MFAILMIDLTEWKIPIDFEIEKRQTKIGVYKKAKLE